MSATRPTWTTDIHRLFSNPCWLQPLQQALRESGWQERLEQQAVDLHNPTAIRQWSLLIYQHLASQPPCPAPTCSSFRLEDALEIFRRWVNQGWRLDPEAPVKMAERIARGHGVALPPVHPWQGHARLASHGRKAFTIRPLELTVPARHVPIRETSRATKHL